jgi:hypothetical protein
MDTASPGDQRPVWAKDDSDASVVIPAALLRAWDENCEGDKDAIATFTSQRYQAYRDALQRFAACDDPLYESVGSVYRLVAPAVAFALLGRLITRSHLDALELAVRTVFGTIEQAVLDIWDVSEEEDRARITATPRYSNWLRDGLAETLLAVAFLGRPPSSGVLEQVGGGQAFVDRLARALPGLGSDPRMLASLREQLPYLAEAAPAPFVEALESLLQGDPSSLKPLFRDRGFFGPMLHTGLLWALETLAWSSSYLPRVTLLLGAFDEIDPGGKVGNRPINSLREIYLAWHPGTAASVEERVASLSLLCERHPTVGWKLLLKLLPHPHDTATPTHEPAWHDYGRSDMPPLTNRVIAKAYRGYAELALDLAQANLGRQIDLLEAYPNFPTEYRDRVLDMLKESRGRPQEERVRVEAWTKLRHIVAHHRSFSDAAWALKETDLKALEKLSQEFLPEDAVARHKWLFDNQWPEIGHRAEDFDGKQHEIDEQRRAAIRDIALSQGWSGLHKLVREAQHPYIPAVALAEVVESDTELLEALGSWANGRSSGELMAIRAASRVRAQRSQTWTKELIDYANKAKWAPDVVATSLLDYPCDIETFRLVASLGSDVEHFYWTHCWFHVSQCDAETKKFVAENYIRYGRPSDMLDAAGQNLEGLGVPLVVRLLDDTIKQFNEGRLPQQRGMFSYHLANAFKWLRKQTETDRLTLARLEYAFLPLLVGPGHEGEDTLALHRLLSEDPGFFVQVLCDLYKPASKPREQPVDENSKARAEAAWRLLDSWTIVPGTKNSKDIDPEVLEAWITTARTLARERDRADVCDLQIGQVLFHADKEPETGVWPPLVILDLIERLSSKALERGFALECVNSRGVTWRAPLDGGNQERTLERQWADRAKALEPKWPRVKALFLHIAEDWKNQARWHDDDAAKLRMQWS